MEGSWGAEEDEEDDRSVRMASVSRRLKNSLLFPSAGGPVGVVSSAIIWSD